MSERRFSLVQLEISLISIGFLQLQSATLSKSGVTFWLIAKDCSWKEKGKPYFMNGTLVKTVFSCYFFPYSTQIITIKMV